MYTIPNNIQIEDINKNEIFYCKDGVMSYNAILNFLIGGRGTGKTYAFKLFALTSGSEFVWVRRYDKDLDELVEKDAMRFMEDLFKEGLFLDDKITVQGHTLYLNGIPKIHFVALSISHKKKSLAYPGVDFIVFDEFIETRTNKKYLPNECEMFLDLVETINRLRIDRPEVRCFLIGNKVSFVNPYFTFFKIRPFTQRFKTFNGGLIVVENYSNEKFAELKKKTRFGRLIKGTKYADYAIDNVVWRDTNAFIEKRHKDSELVLNCRYGGLTFGVWLYNGILYCSKAYNTTSPTFAPRYDMKDSEYPLRTTREPISWFFGYLDMGKLRFDDNMIKETVFEIMQENLK